MAPAAIGRDPARSRGYRGREGAAPARVAL